jgi:hypothetical protein
MPALRVSPHPPFDADRPLRRGANYDSDALPGGQKYCRPDIVIGPGPKPLNASAMEQILDLKFPCNKDGKLPSQDDWSPEMAMGGAQRKCYEQIKLPPPRGDGQSASPPVSACGPTKEACGE